MEPFNIALIGCGTVGAGVVKLLVDEGDRLAARAGRPLVLKCIVVKNADKSRSPWVPHALLTTDLNQVLRDPSIQAAVEVVGGVEWARKTVLDLLAAGKDVVTANKALLAIHGHEVFEAGRRHKKAIAFEASVGGGIPIIGALSHGLAANQILSLQGILNGTCNFILTEMETTGREYADILEDAQRLGYAEADSSSDVEGADAAYKLTLLSRMCFGQSVEFEQIFREGITRLMPCDFIYARQLDRTPRQLASCTQLASGKLLLSVRTHMVPNQSILAKVQGPFNAVQVNGKSGGEFVFYGRGAGGDPTAVAVLSDIVEIARSGARMMVPPLGFSRFAPFAPAGPADFVAPFYLRFVVRDQPGIIASISRSLADHGININAVLQAPFADKEALPFVITLEPVSQSQLQEALGDIGKFGFHTQPPLALPM